MTQVVLAVLVAVAAAAAAVPVPPGVKTITSVK